jgi:hypothetical protein
MGRVLVKVQQGDVLSYSADVLALKYAQDLHGADLDVYECLSKSSRELISLPTVGGAALVETDGLIPSSQVLFLGVPPLHQFDYPQIREFGRRVLAFLANQASGVRHLALTIHGPGYGLDEIEAFESELAGVADSVSLGHCPVDLARITFVERNPGRAQRLQEVLGEALPDGFLVHETTRSRGLSAGGARETFRDAGRASAEKPWIFVAMPFDESMDDLFHYGIQGGVRAAGFSCERADLSSFVGDVMSWVKQRIEGAAFVIADLSTANPNVYLEVGYAWGCGRPTVLIVRDTTELKFDVKSQRCLKYKSIQHLEEILGNELKALVES